MHHLPCRPWCRECVEARGVDDPPPHHRQPAWDEYATPKVMFDIFPVGSDEIAKSYTIADGCFSLHDKGRLLSSQEVDQTIAVLNLTRLQNGCPRHTPRERWSWMSTKSTTLWPCSASGNTQPSYHRQTKSRRRCPSPMRLEIDVRSLRSSEAHRHTPSRMQDTYRFLVNSVGWMITRFQPRSHWGSRPTGSSSAASTTGDIAEMGEQLWYRISARVFAGRGKWEARFARGI